MRFKIDLKLPGDPPFLLPQNYQSEFSAWVHKMLHFQDASFLSWLKQKSYLDAHGEYKLFTFSDIMFSGLRHQNDRLLLEDDKASFVLSFYADPEIEEFVQNMFLKAEFKIGDSKGKVPFKVESVQSIKDPVFPEGKSVRFRCSSPMLINEPGKSDGMYLAPDQKGFDKVFFKNLMFKYANLIKFMPGQSGNGLANLKDLQFKLEGKPKPKIVKIKTDTPHQKSVKGYVFDFSMKAPVELVKIGFMGGFGDLNHLGFGCCEFVSS